MREAWLRAEPTLRDARDLGAWLWAMDLLAAAVVTAWPGEEREAAEALLRMGARARASSDAKSTPRQRTRRSAYRPRAAASPRRTAIRGFAWCSRAGVRARRAATSGPTARPVGAACAAGLPRACKVSAFPPGGLHEPVPRTGDGAPRRLCKRRRTLQSLRQGPGERQRGGGTRGHRRHRRGPTGLLRRAHHGRRVRPAEVSSGSQRRRAGRHVERLRVARTDGRGSSAALGPAVRFTRHYSTAWAQGA
jgi:hypothetical protein